MRTLAEIVKTPVVELTDEEIELMPPESRDWARSVKERLEREAACPGHEAVSTAPPGHDHRRGWHPARCRHCGKDMSIDSSD